MKTATIYTLQARTIPVSDFNSVDPYRTDVYMGLLPLGSDPPVLAPRVEIERLKLHEVYCRRIEQPHGILDPKQRSFPHSDYHIFAVEPALQRILEAPFRDSAHKQLSATCDRLREEKVLLIVELDAIRDRNEKLKGAESKVTHLEERIKAMTENQTHYESVLNRVYEFSRGPLWKRLWVAFRNNMGDG